MTNLIAIILVVAIVLLIWFGITSVVAFLFQTAWNAVVVISFGGPHLTYWGSFGILVLLSIIGGAFKSHVSVNRK